MGKCKDYTIDGKCSKCGGCCSAHLPVTKSELKALKRWAKKHHYKPVFFAGSDADFDMTCPFLDKATHTCACYKVRPAICRDFLCSTFEGDEKFRRRYHNYTVFDLRKELFNEATLPIAQAQALVDYLDSRRGKE